MAAVDVLVVAAGSADLMTLARAAGMHCSASAGLFVHDRLIIRRTLLLLLLRNAASMPAAAAPATAATSMTGTRTYIDVTMRHDMHLTSDRQWRLRTLMGT
jgi:hypothetical protein